MTPEQVLTLFKSKVEQGVFDAAALEALRTEFLSKSGHIPALMQQLGKMPQEQRSTYGASVNGVKQEIEAEIARIKGELEQLVLLRKLANERVDVTLPFRNSAPGALHPISQAMREMHAIASHLGFMQADGPEIEDDWHNFTALNIGELHPARQMHDTFYCTIENQDLAGAPNPGRLLRTHTSTVQIRHLSQQKPPVKLFSMGRVYRADYDATHTPMFHQMEGVYVDHKVSMAQLKGFLETFIALFFGTEIEIRLRPSYFPFTEPSAEVDVRCDRSNPEKIAIGSGDDWLEILGCGLIHPNVLRNVGIDPQSYQGFAFGLGIERFAMLKYGIPDLRYMYDGDIRRFRETA